MIAISHKSIYLKGKIKGTWYFKQLNAARRHKNCESRYVLQNKMSTKIQCHMHSSKTTSSHFVNEYACVFL